MTTPQDPFGTPPEETRSGSGSAPETPYGSHPAGQPGYGRAGSPGGPVGSPKNGLGVAALVLGVLAFPLSADALSITDYPLGGVLVGSLAIVLGLMGRERAKRGEATNGKMALAGAILGALGPLIPLGLIALVRWYFDTGEKPSVLGSVVTMLLVGAIAGFVARVLLPGKEAMGLQQTIVLGIVGSFAGGLLSYGSGQGLRTSIIGAIIGAVVALLVYNAVTKKSRAA